jgi:hypothetical protein
LSLQVREVEAEEEEAETEAEAEADLKSDGDDGVEADPEVSSAQSTQLMIACKVAHNVMQDAASVHLQEAPPPSDAESDDGEADRMVSVMLLLIGVISLTMILHGAMVSYCVQSTLTGEGAGPAELRLGCTSSRVHPGAHAHPEGAH